MRAFHLLPAKWGLTAIRNKRIKIARFNDLNDPFELFGANLRDKAARVAFRRWKSQISELYGLLCFSKSWGSPLLWSHYAQKHNGICLGFDLPDEKVVTVTYQATRIEFNEADLTVESIESFLSTKYSEWNYEKEVRIVTELAEVYQIDKNYYADFNEDLVLREVVVGALCEISRDEVATEVCGAGLDFSGVGLSKARLAFKSFAVVPDKRGLR